MTGTGKIPLAGTFKKKRANTYALVLAAAGIDYIIEKCPGGYKIFVDGEDYERAAEEIALFKAENPVLHGAPEIEAPTGHSGSLAAGVLAAFYWLLGPFERNRYLLSRYGADSGLILDGEWERCVTALFLHADFIHLIGNMGGVLVFGTLAARTAGWGAGWLLILFTGFTGNLLTALAYGADHLSGGASTAVFGAIGLLGGFRLAPPGGKLNPKNSSAWMVLGTGGLLIALLGNSPEADIAAHFFGYAAGIATGIAYGRIFSAPLEKKWQAACLYTGAAAVIASFSMKG